MKGKRLVIIGVVAAVIMAVSATATSRTAFFSVMIDVRAC